MEINLHMFGALVLYGVGGEVDRRDVVAVDDGGTCRRAMKLDEELPQPARLGDAVSHCAILGFSARTGDSVLAFG
jgi:hypothetical protein